LNDIFSDDNIALIYEWHF